MSGRRAGALSAVPRDLTLNQNPPSITITLRLATELVVHFNLTITNLFILRSSLQLSFELLHYRPSSHCTRSSTDQRLSHVTMPRKFITVPLELRVTCTIIHSDLSIPAPLPIEESDVESTAEDVPSTKAEVIENKDEPADATMKDEENEDDEEDEEDAETSV